MTIKLKKGQMYRVRPHVAMLSKASCMAIDVTKPVQYKGDIDYGRCKTMVLYTSHLSRYPSEGFLHAEDLLPLKKKRTGKRKKKLKLRKVSRY